MRTAIRDLLDSLVPPSGYQSEKVFAARTELATISADCLAWRDRATSAEALLGPQEAEIEELKAEISELRKAPIENGREE